jgi:hypothetical protein
MATYYVDSRNGSDANQGDYPSRAWLTISKVNATTFAAGDTIYFRRSSIPYVGKLNPLNSGSAGNVITLAAYGATADYPYAIISNPVLGTNANCISLARNYWIIEGFEFRDSEDAAIQIFQTNNHNTVR